MSCQLILIKGLLTLLFLTVFCFAIGDKLISSSSKNSSNTFLSYFERLFFGAALLISIISLLTTRGQSISIGIVLIGLFFFIERKFHPPILETESETKKMGLPGIFILLLFLLVCFSWQAISIFWAGDFPGSEIEKDGVFYAELSRCLIESGHENSFTTANFFYKNYQSPTPYHYFDLWLNGAVSWLTGFNPVYCLYLVTYPFFMLLLLLGLMSVCEHYGKINVLSILACLALLFVSGTRTSEYIPATSHYSAEMLGLTERSYGGKLLPAYCVIIYSFYLFLLQQKRSALILLLLLPVFSISFAPGVFSGLFIFSLIKCIRNKEERNFYLRLLVYTLLTAVLIFCFYTLIKKTDLNFRMDKPIGEYSDLDKGIKYTLAELFHKSRLLPILFLLNYLPFLLPLVFLFARKKAGKKMQDVFILCILISTGSMLCFNTFYKLGDTYQFYIHSLILFHVIFCICFLKFLSSENNALTKQIVVFIFIASCSYNAFYSFSWHTNIKSAGMKFSPLYLADVQKLCKQQNRILKGVILPDTIYYSDHSNADPLELYSFPISIAGLAHHPTNLTLPTSYKEISGFQNQNLISRSPFFIFVEREKNRKHLKKEEAYQLSFIAGHHLDFVICNKGSKRIALKNIKVSVQDELSGQEFILLSKKND